MTTDERTKVAALCRKLFPDQAPPAGVDWENEEWNQRMWDVYEALIEVELI